MPRNRSVRLAFQCWNICRSQVGTWMGGRASSGGDVGRRPCLPGPFLRMPRHQPWGRHWVGLRGWAVEPGVWVGAGPASAHMTLGPQAACSFPKGEGHEVVTRPFVSFWSSEHSSESAQLVVRAQTLSLPLCAPSRPPAAHVCLLSPADRALLCQTPAPPGNLCVEPGWGQSRGRPDHRPQHPGGLCGGSRNGTRTDEGCGLGTEPGTCHE